VVTGSGLGGRADKVHTACGVVAGPRRLHGGLADVGPATHHFRGHAVGFLVQPGDVTVAADMRQRRAIFVDQGLGKANVDRVCRRMAGGSRGGSTLRAEATRSGQLRP
jgi:hypothetical protein